MQFIGLVYFFLYNTPKVLFLTMSTEATSILLLKNLSVTSSRASRDVTTTSLRLREGGATREPTQGTMNGQSGKWCQYTSKRFVKNEEKFGSQKLLDFFVCFYTIYSIQKPYHVTKWGAILLKPKIGTELLKFLIFDYIVL